MLPDDRVADAPQSVPPLLYPAQGCVPLGQGSIVLNPMSEAEDRDDIAHGHLGLACFEALIAAPERKASQVGCAGHESCLVRPSWWGQSEPS